MSEGPAPLRPVHYGVVPAGGLGTRFLPISRTVPKELLPLVDTPVIELVVSELASAGVDRVVIVIAPGKESLDAYFRPNERLEHRLAVEFRQQDIDLLTRPEKLANVRVVMQDEAKGNGEALAGDVLRDQLQRAGLRVGLAQVGEKKARLVGDLAGEVALIEGPQFDQQPADALA